MEEALSTENQTVDISASGSKVKAVVVTTNEGYHIAQAIISGYTVLRRSRSQPPQ
jgi:hypothetical protein